MAGRLVSPVVKLSKQKIITGKIVDVLGSLCSVRLSGRGLVLHGLKYVGAKPAAGDTVIVDYRSGVPRVLTNTENVDEKIAEAVESLSATNQETQVTPPPPPENPSTSQPDLIVNDESETVQVVGVTQIIFPDDTVTDLGGGVVQIDVSGSGGAEALDDLTDVDAPTPAAGDVLIFNGANWVAGAFPRIVMQSGITHPPVPVENSEGDDWVYTY